MVLQTIKRIFRFHVYKGSKERKLKEKKPLANFRQVFSLCEFTIKIKNIIIKCILLIYELIVNAVRQSISSNIKTTNYNITVFDW